MTSKILSTIIIISMASMILSTPVAAYQTGVSVNAPERVDGNFSVVIQLPDETPTPVSTRTPTETTSRSASDSQPSPGKTSSSTVFHTDPSLAESPTGNNGLGSGITLPYTLIGLIAVLFALMQIRRS